MDSDKTLHPGESASITGGTVHIRVESARESRRLSLLGLILLGLLAASVMMNVALIVSGVSDGMLPGAVQQVHRDGTKNAREKLAVIQFSGTIMPPFSERWISQIRHAAEDEAVKGVLLEIDSPGGLVADSHQIFHELQKLREDKPVYVSMKRMAASGGYYIAMGAGPEARVYAEPTTWTGSIGVILPRYNAAELASKIGVKTEPLTTGPLKGSLSPFRDLRDDSETLGRRRSILIATLVTNRVLSALIAVRSTTRFNRRASADFALAPPPVGSSWPTVRVTVNL